MRSIRSMLITGSLTALLIPATSFALSTPVTEAEMEAMQQAQTNGTGSQTTTTTHQSTSSIDGGFLESFLNGTTATDSSLSTAFDIRAFRSHPCFSAVGEEQNYCLALFGVSTDFESMLQGNEIGRLIVEHALRMRCADLTGEEHAACTERNAAVLPQLLAQVNIQVNTGSVMENTDNVATDDDADAVEEITMNRHARSQHLWELCEGHEETQAGCYQNYLRFVTDETVSAAEIEAVLGSGRAPATTDDRDKDTDETDDDEDTDMSGMDRATNRRTTQDDDTDETDADDNDTDTDDVQSATDEDIPTSRREREEWLWDLCAENSQGQSMCYRSHLRTAINTDTDLKQLKEDLQG